MYRITQLRPYLFQNNNLKFFSTHGKDKPFDKILIANRGEIACRVIRTAKRLGVKTVAVYSEADAAGMHVRMADEAYCIGPASSKDSYLRMDRILQVALDSGAQGIHPGYGFLSENAKFVDMVEAAGIAFIGPSSAPMNAMGDKINSKKIAKDAGCFIIPGYQGEVATGEDAVRLAKEVGYPVMIKASAGGGGKGMRVAYNDAEVVEGFKLSKAEALSSFGDDRMLIERFIENPHHIEIQVLADSFGNVVAFPERECSVQRRNQKVVEESPSCLLTPKTRRLMQEQAIMLCKATNYRSAGTVEMLADDQQNFYFLEMNTRLQVEHPITELVSGEDLVEHMLWIASGKPLPKRLTDLQCLPFKGSAIESRVYAEDPLRNFLPAIGPLVTYKEPKLFSTPTTAVRIDTGVFEGGSISMHYDPMIAKLCTYAPFRGDAIALMEDALSQYVVQGLGNNITFLQSVYRNEKFRSGNYCTKFIGEEYPEGFKGVVLNPREKNELIIVAAAMHQARTENNPNNEIISALDEYNDTRRYSFIAILKGLNGDHTQDESFRVDLELSQSLKSTVVPISKKNEEVGNPAIMIISNLIWQTSDPLAEVYFADESGHSYEDDKPTIFQYLGRSSSSDGYIIRHCGSEREIVILSPLEFQLNQFMLPIEKKDVSKFLLSPMPGTLISCNVIEGQKVEIGQQLAVIEAMKMQNVLRAEKSGIIKSILKSKAGSSLKVDEVIMTFE
eukprot:gene7590-10339_t